MLRAPLPHSVPTAIAHVSLVRAWPPPSRSATSSSSYSLRRSRNLPFTGSTVQLIISPASCTSAGIDTASLYAVDHNLGDILTVSYSECESDVTAAVTPSGTHCGSKPPHRAKPSSFSTGDTGAGGCNAGTDSFADRGYGVNALGSSADNVAVAAPCSSTTVRRSTRAPPAPHPTPARSATSPRPHGPRAASAPPNSTQPPRQPSRTLACAHTLDATFVPQQDGAITAIATLTLTPAPVALTLSGLTATYDGKPHAAVGSTMPAGLPVDLTYNGQSPVPPAAGSYPYLPPSMIPTTPAALAQPCASLQPLLPPPCRSAAQLR